MTIKVSILIECDCGAETAYDLDDIVTGVECPGCGKKILMRQSLRFYEGEAQLQA